MRHSDLTRLNFTPSLHNTEHIPSSRRVLSALTAFTSRNFSALRRNALRSCGIAQVLLGAGIQELPYLILKICQLRHDG